MKSLKFLFKFDDTVGRKPYVLWGLGLALLKYAIDAGIVWFNYGKLWTLLGYLSPSLLLREKELKGLEETFTSSPDSVLMWMALVSLPFAWIGLSMSIRRAANAGISPWIGVLFLVPVVNYLMILVLCFLPERRDLVVESVERQSTSLIHAMMAFVIGVSITLSMIATSVYVLGDYGWSLFIGTPFVVGAVAGFIVNRKRPATIGSTIGVGVLTIVLSGLATLLIALEGIICIGMAAVPAIAAVIPGSLIGQFIAISTIHKGRGLKAVTLVVTALPLLAAVESTQKNETLREVATSVEIDASPMEVWNSVIHFSELDPPNDWVFATGIAYPMRAKLVGEGVGAVRYCEFSTGPFVEPITVWEPGKRLSFDVESQPLPMKEWSPYRHIHPPHLDGYFRSKRGEFRFVDLGNGKTRLEGSTWYELDLAPYAYWTFLSDALLHHIHRRVLDHVKVEAEAEPEA